MRFSGKRFLSAVAAAAAPQNAPAAAAGAVAATATRPAVSLSEKLFAAKSALAHTPTDAGRFYVIPDSLTTGPTVPLRANARPGLVTCGAGQAVLLRRPVLDLAAQLLKTTANSCPRVFVEGSEGTGKSVALGYIAQVCHEAGWLVAYVPRASKWSHQSGDVDPAPGNPSQLLQYADAAEWLESFLATNKSLLEGVAVRASLADQNFELPSIDANPSLLQLVESGVAEPRLATGVVSVLLGELATLKDGPKVLVAVDGWNAWDDTVIPLYNTSLMAVTVDQLPLIQAFKPLVSGQNTLANGAVLAAPSSAHGLVPPFSPAARAVMAAKKLPPTDANFAQSVKLGNFSPTELHALLQLVNFAGWSPKSPDQYTVDMLRHVSGLSPRESTRLAMRLI